MFELSFVDSISAAPVSRLNLNDGTLIRTLANGTDFGMPPMDRAIVSTPLTDGATVPAAAFGNRLITLVLDMSMCPDKDISAQYLQKVTKELNRPHIPMGQPVNILRYRPGTSEPVFFRCLRSAFTDVRWNEVSQVATATVLAEPFAYGVRKTLASVTVNNDPAAGSNGMFFDVAAADAIGDVETPLNLKVTRGAGFGIGGYITCVSVRRRGTPSLMPMVLQAEAMTAWTDTSIQANNVIFSGAGSNSMRTTFATAAMTTRLQTTMFPASPSVDARGTYRVFARVRNTAGVGGQMRVQLGYGPATSSGGYETVLNDPVTLALGSSSPVWTDLGLLAIPHGPDPGFDAYTNTELPAGGIGLSLRAERLSGAGNLDWDVILLLPADDRLAFVKYANLAVSGLDFEIIDSIHDSVWTQEGTGPFSTGVLTGSSHIGGLPVISPGVTNRICWLLNTKGEEFTDALTTTTTIEPSYLPRYLHVRPVES